MSRTTRFIMTICLVWAVVGCTGSPAPETPVPVGRPVTPAWSSIEVGADAWPSAPSFEITGSVPSTKELPVLYVGSTTTPGGQRRATVWRMRGKGPLGESTVLDLAGSWSRVDTVASDGETTVIAGYRWIDGDDLPYAMVSKDREHWSPVDLPTAVLDRAIYLRALSVLPGGGLLALGTDAEDRPVAVNLTAGTVVDLPEPDSAVPDGISGLVALGNTLLALVHAKDPDGGGAIVAYQSDDAGASWGVAGTLAGEQPTVAGLVARPGRALATGSQEIGGDERPAVWGWQQGRGWFADTVPDHPSEEGWDVRLGAPVIVGDDVVAPVISSLDLETIVMGRSWDSMFGRDWAEMVELPAWSGPAPGLHLERDGVDLRGVRTGWGQLESGRLSGLGSGGSEVRWASTGRTEATVAPVEWWDAVGVDGDVPVLLGRRAATTMSKSSGWRTGPRLQRYTIQQGKLQKTPWDLKQAEGLSAVSLATDAEGRTVLLGGVSATDTAGGTDVAGWVREPGGPWVRAEGLGGSRAEWPSHLVQTNGEWIAVGTDRDDLSGGHGRGAVWTSKDGRSWARAKGPFDVAADRDSSLSGVCALPDGSLLAVGVVVNLGTGSAPLAFRRIDGTWRRQDLSGLPSGITRLLVCSAVGERVVVRTTGLSRDTWVTSDGKTFASAAVGVGKDAVRAVVPVPGGLAAPGRHQNGTAARPVVWLSADGVQWHAVEVPVTMRVTVSHTVAWRDRLLVTLVGPSGPAVMVLDNLGEVLGSY